MASAGDALIGVLGKFQPAAAEIEALRGLSRAGRLIDVGVQPIDDESALFSSSTVLSGLGIFFPSNFRFLSKKTNSPENQCTKECRRVVGANAACVPWLSRRWRRCR